MSKKIIGLDGKPATGLSKSEEAAARRQQRMVPIKREHVIKAINACRKFDALDAAEVCEPGDGAEQTGILNFLASTFLEHREEFLGCWLAMQDEYDPLVKGMASLLQRAHGVIAQRQQHAQAQMQAAMEEKATDTDTTPATE